MAEDERKLYVANLPPDITEAEISEVFELYGPLVEVYIAVPRDTQAVRSAFVRFEEVQDAAAAMAVLSDMFKFREDAPKPTHVSVARLGVGISGSNKPPTPPAPGVPLKGPVNGMVAGGCDAGHPPVAVGVPVAPPVVPPQLPQPPLAPGMAGHPAACADPTNGYADGRWGGGGWVQSNSYPSISYPSSAGVRDPVSGRDINAKLWVGNLPQDITKEVLEKVFGTYGTVEEINILPAKSRSGQLCCFVHYANPQQADICIAAMQVGYELRPGEGELKVERPASRARAEGRYPPSGKGGPPRRYYPY